MESANQISRINKKKKRVTVNVLTFVLEDQELVLDLLRKGFEDAGIDNYRFFTNPAEMLGQVDSSVHIAVVDYNLNADINGFETMVVLLQKNPFCYTVIMSATNDVNVVVDFLNNGARSFVRKKDNYIPHVVLHVSKAIAHVKEHLSYYYELLEKEKEINKIRKK